MVVKGVLKLPSLHMLLTKKSQPLHRTFACRTFWGIANSVIYSINDPDMLSSASDKAKLFAKNISKNSNLDD